MCKLKRTRMCRRPSSILRSRKGFIADILVDFWAYFTFILVVVIFALLYKWTASKTNERLADFQGTTWSNYLASTYLRTPVVVGDTEMTMAELIALYDYNQTLGYELKKKREGIKEGTVGETVSKVLAKVQGSTIYTGDANPLFQGITSVTNKFIDQNFDAFNTCYLFILKGEYFEISKHGSVAKCTKYARMVFTGGTYQAFNMELGLEDLEPLLDTVPKEAFLTYIPSLDPRAKPIRLYVVWDIDKTVKLDDKTFMEK